MGVCMGTLDRKGFKINHAFYKAYADRFYNCVELDEKQAKVYLSGNVVDDIKSESNGICVVKYKGIPLGGGKVVGNTLKNYYPKGLRA